MKIEKRDEAAESSAPVSTAPQQNAPTHKPVVKYLVILFIIAVALILASFVMNQHSNAKVLQELQGQVETLQQLQNTEAKYHEAMAEIEALNKQIEELTVKNEEAASAQQALELLWQLEHLYADGKNDACHAIIKDLKQDDLYLLLPANAEGKEDSKYESPAAAFQRIDEALNPTEKADASGDDKAATQKDGAATEKDAQ